MPKSKYADYKFHCSSLPKLMTNARKAGEVLSETAKTYLDELWIESEYGRKKYITSNAMQKGTMVETDSLELLERVTGQKYFKNNEQISNDYVIGTPDVKKPLIDIKSSWDLWTFHSVDEKDALDTYEWQVKGYAWILGVKTAELIYILVNTPENLIQNEIFRLAYSMPESEAEKYRHNFVFDDIAEAFRIKRYTINIEDTDFEDLKLKVEAARVYMDNITL